MCHSDDREAELPEKMYPMEKENEETPPKESSSSVDLTNKIQLVFNLDGIKEAGGLLYIGYEDEISKTNPSKIAEWFTAEFLNLHRIYAIKEEEPFLLRIFTRNHETINKGIRKKGGRKVMLMGQEVFGDVLLACGRCGYWSQEGSNVRRHLKKSVCLKERNYCKEDLVGLNRNERRKFLRRLATAKCRAKKKSKVTSEDTIRDAGVDIGNSRVSSDSPRDPASCSLYPPLPLNISSEGGTTEYAECLVEIQEASNCDGQITQGSSACNSYVNQSTSNCRSNMNQQGTKTCISPAACTANDKLPTAKRKPTKYKALTLGPALATEVVLRIPYDIFTVNEKNERVAWKPPSCHKAGMGDPTPCQIVFRGARMKRRCMDLPVPKVLVYRKLDCKTHHCNFTLFHPTVREAFSADISAKASVAIKMYGDIVMTQEFYHYIVSLLSVMKMNTSQTARHLTGVWETILGERLGTSTIPPEYRKIITLSKQTVKSIWSSIEEEAGSKDGIRLFKGLRRKRKVAPATPLITPISAPPVSSLHSPAPPPPLHPPPPHPPANVGQLPLSCNEVTQTCMKRVNGHMTTKPQPPLPQTHPPHGTPKTSMMLPPPPPHTHPPPPAPHHNSMPQVPHTTVTHTHWLGQTTTQYPHNMAPYPMSAHPPPPPPASAEYYHMPGHFMTQYTPATMGTSP
ncbi:hypothetical protein Pcinc_037974 [Petrolisthes cinctipes]|uniref:Uncharacterized protein n=1 Tax=Petrolisthes cinctipes TaxID=88211 RepID=A0AAE1BRL6_PETCI|nr:hypothetical protein Pcinc_037974 [Petrolisthes cinctipes]